jgi:hypothetical protein
MLQALCLFGQSKLDIFLDRKPTVLVLCMNNTLLIYAGDGGSVFVLNTGANLPDYTVL